MRDSTAFNLHQANAKRNALLLSQFEFLKTRQEAAERVLKVSRLRDRINWIIWPDKFMELVDAVQVNLLNEAKRKMEAVAAKPKIDVVRAL